jgi:hypothetical protein
VRHLRWIVIVVGLCVSISSFSLPVDDPGTPYNESEAPINLAAPTPTIIASGALVSSMPFAKGLSRMVLQHPSSVYNLPSVTLLEAVRGSAVGLSFVCVLRC